jgi:hypothetical protein
MNLALGYFLRGARQIIGWSGKVKQFDQLAALRAQLSG